MVSDGFVYLFTCRGVEAWGPPTEEEAGEAEGDKQDAPEANAEGDG